MKKHQHLLLDVAKRQIGNGADDIDVIGALEQNGCSPREAEALVEQAHVELDAETSRTPS